ncbi:50S ribosomal protein L39e [Sulfodiicoccus acidiphilus]|uniref:Large ribosomal subunit protein eL39 n=1 Tax=Sulfodiicoccus acidiphilus TaxID=1670455 RepID=A0A348B2Z8_9CREN|nr:50S ribosomal protein L39e [Sulfodiicoccus acidiphilus]BBD72550.1 50S ribosomal protein L39e [Sulfodiicoccus acidiphilus]
MSKAKPLALKLRLGKKLRANRAIPAWIILRTNNEVRYNPIRRNWRRTKLKV